MFLDCERKETPKSRSPARGARFSHSPGSRINLELVASACAVCSKRSFPEPIHLANECHDLSVASMCDQRLEQQCFWFLQQYRGASVIHHYSP